jgi:hypothetical protein
MNNEAIKANWEEIKVKDRVDFFKKLQLMDRNFYQYIEEHKNGISDKDKRLLRAVEAYFRSLIDVQEYIDHLIFLMVDDSKEE